jgi:hypothetical protein
MTRIRPSIRLVLFLVFVVLPFGAAGAVDGKPSRKQPVRFSDAQSQAEEFVGYARSIRLTARQREIFEAALGSMASPCCKDFRLSTCCCPCNLAKSAWGLANLLIARHGSSAGEVKEMVAAWIEFVNPSGFSGDVCVTGGCGRQFGRNGCGGMDETDVNAHR